MSLPDVLVRVNQLIDDPRSSAYELGRVIEQDAALSARLLRIVNSPFYGFPSSIATISRAITVIGTRDLRDLVLATTAVQAFHRIEPGIMDPERFWRRNLQCAIIARMLAGQRRDMHPERFFVAGLLHDLGTLVLCQQLPELAEKCLREAQTSQEPLYRIERREIGFSHCELGAELARGWNFPSTLIETMRFHHEPQYADLHPQEVTVVHVADSIVDSLDNEEEAPCTVQPGTWDVLKLAPEDLNINREEVKRQFNDMKQLLFGRERAA